MQAYYIAKEKRRETVATTESTIQTNQRLQPFRFAWRKKSGATWKNTLSSSAQMRPTSSAKRRSLTRLLKSMDEKGLIYREADKTDKRSVRIYLTREGKKAKRRPGKRYCVFNEAVREQVPGHKLDVFFEVLGEINKMIETQ